jgi:hypothetical protein
MRHRDLYKQQITRPSRVVFVDKEVIKEVIKEVEKPIYIDKINEIEKIIYLDKEIQVPVYIDKIKEVEVIKEVKVYLYNKVMIFIIVIL